MDRGVMYYFLYAMRMRSFQPMARYDEKETNEKQHLTD